ncbi:MAG: hypothetical protein AB8G05_11515 [Oligoflexales bacterium]
MDVDLSTENNSKNQDYEPVMEHLNFKLKEYIDNRDIRSPSEVLKLYVAYSAAYSAAWKLAKNAAQKAAWYIARNAAWSVAKNTAENAAYDAAQKAAWSVARKVAQNAVSYASYDTASYVTSYAAYAAAQNTTDAAYDVVFYNAFEAAYDTYNTYDTAGAIHEWSLFNHLRTELIGKNSYQAAEWASLISFSENLDRILDSSFKAVQDKKFSISKESLMASIKQLEGEKTKTVQLFLTPITETLKDHLETL